MGNTFTSNYNGGSNSGFKQFMETADDAGQKLLVTLRREEQNTRLQIEEMRKTVRLLAKKGIFEKGDDDENPELSAEDVITEILKLERFRAKCIRLNDKIVRYQKFYNKDGTGNASTMGGSGTSTGTMNSPQFRANLRSLAQRLGNIRTDAVYREKNGPLEQAAEREWPEPLIIEDRIRTFCDLGGDQGHAADPVPNGTEYAEVDPEFTTEDYLEAYAKAEVKSFDPEPAKTYYEGTDKGTRAYGSGAPVRQLSLEDTSIRSFGR